MTSEVLAQRLAQLSAADKQRLLAHLLRKKAEQQVAQQPRVDLHGWVRDASLDPGIQPAGGPSHPGDPRTVLLTGATGFLGAHLLADLCNYTAATIYCVVRARDEPEARRRLELNFARYFAHAVDWDRVRPLVGDLAQPHLGLTPQTNAMLAREIDAIVHNGAQLHHLAPYAQLKAVNVNSTVALLRLAATTKPKWLYYVSTLVAVVDRDSDGWLREDLPTEDPVELAGGYAQSKWVSERLLSEAAHRGIGVTIFRPGFISGRSDTGAWPVEDDHLLRAVKGCVQLGYAPDSDLIPNMAPVDFVSAAIVRIALSRATTGQVFNLSNPRRASWEMLLGWLRSLGYRLSIVPNEVWREQHLAGLNRDNALFPVLPLYLGGDTTDRHVKLLSKLAKVRTDRTAEALARLQMAFPAIDRALWQRYVTYFQQCGFLPIPA